MNKEKVIVALSGGVDSSTAAIMLKNKGFKVQGIFLDFFNSAKNRTEVKKIAKKIGINAKIINASEIFKKKVIDYFLKELKDGKTPNPCIVCNKEIKFKILFNELAKSRAHYVATGHYALIKKVANPPSLKLWRARDKNKDQSYFLYKLTQKELSKIVFPLGNYTKPQVRRLAKKLGLPVHDKKESQDICFVPKNSYKNFLKKMFSPKQGKICDISGEILGIHEGLPLYTIGQREGIKVGGNGPYYVIEKDFEKNRIIVSNKSSDLLNKKIKLKDISWSIEKPKFPFKTLVCIRYRSPLISAIINKDGNVIFKEPQRAITPGQSAVFYSKNGEVLGGGIIK